MAGFVTMRRMIPIRFSSSAFFALCLITTGCQTTAPDRFAQADSDRSGVLSRDEVNHYLVTPVFRSRDTNHDGKLTQAEWLAGDDAGQEKIFNARDADRDGVVTLDEALAYGKKKGTTQQFFREADADKDGVLTREEVTRYYGSKEGAPN